MKEEILQPPVYTVSEITRSIKRVLEGNEDFNNIWVRGEIYNLTFHSSGHIYFTLKDDNAVLSAVFFKYANKKLNFKMKEGMNILAFGNITVFEKRGGYQINVAMVKPEGIGDLQRRIEELKKKLHTEGIFDPAHKKPLPFLPARLGIVTSPTGAAVRDIIKVALRRYPNLEIVIAPAKVQGEDAPLTIVRGIEELNRPGYAIDVIIAGRGGGSFEDLMPFNEEAVVRAFYDSRVPIISAVGHEIDHPLSDESADYAAPTPSAAAETAIPLKKEITDEVDYFILRMGNSVASLFRELTARIEGIVSRRVFREPYEIISLREMQLLDLENRVLSRMKDAVSLGKNSFMSVPDMDTLIKAIINGKSYQFNMALNALDQLSPLSVLRRGFAIAMDQKKNVIRSVSRVKAGDLISLLMHDGSLDCSVNSVERGDKHGKEKID